jgi:hypothetical protein
MPQPRPAGAPTAPNSPAGPAATTGAPLNITPPAPNPDSSPAAPPIKPASTSSFKFGGQTALGRSLGIEPMPDTAAPIVLDPEEGEKN